MFKSKAKPYEYWTKNQQDPGIAWNEKENDGYQNRWETPGKRIAGLRNPSYLKFIRLIQLSLSI